LFHDLPQSYNRFGKVFRELRRNLIKKSLVLRLRFVDPEFQVRRAVVDWRPFDYFRFCSTMHERASSLLERPEGFFGRNGREYFDIVEWIFRFGR
jgi:hypothetical protein